MGANQSHGLDLANWMGKLPKEKCEGPLLDLAIPGTHDSGSYYLDKTSGIANMEDWVNILIGIVDLISNVNVNDIVHNWAITQHNICLRGQLNIGVRYFDLRVAWRESDQSFYFVHTLYGSKVETAMQEIAAWLTIHPNEVVLLDFNHFYLPKDKDGDDPKHKALTDILEKTFNSKLCPKMEQASDVTLAELRKNNQQVVVFYNNANVAKQWWAQPPGSIVSHWPLGNGTTNIEQLLKFLDKELDEKNQQKSKSFYVSQAILTPDAKTIVGNLSHSLKDVLAIPAMPEIVKWLNGKGSESGSPGPNIVIADFVDLEFLLTVVKLNYVYPVSKPQPEGDAH